MKLSVILLRRQCVDEINILPVEGYTLLGTLTLFIKKSIECYAVQYITPRRKLHAS